MITESELLDNGFICTQQKGYKLFEKFNRKEGVLTNIICYSHQNRQNFCITQDSTCSTENLIDFYPKSIQDILTMERLLTK